MIQATRDKSYFVNCPVSLYLSSMELTKENKEILQRTQFSSQNESNFSINRKRQESVASNLSRGSILQAREDDSSRRSKILASLREVVKHVLTQVGSTTEFMLSDSTRDDNTANSEIIDREEVESILRDPEFCKQLFSLFDEDNTGSLCQATWVDSMISSSWLFP